MAPQLGSQRYRPDVDGLRALAVTLVLVNHADERVLPSGYIGVDVFFVISGFVVAGSMLSGTYGPGWAGLAEFWRRRVLRIIPALLVFVLLTALMLAGFFAVTSEVQFVAAMRTGIAALFAVANLYLIRGASDYFLKDQSFNPFVHTWSLGIEEQFYIGFAVPFFALPKLARRRAAPLLTAIVVLLSAVSLAWFAARMPTSPVATYYSLPARFWELGCGVLIALWARHRDVARPARLAEQVPGLAGLALILVAAMLPTAGAGGARLPIVVAVAGAALVIAAGATWRGLASRALGLRPVVALGLISYSVYLYHWPVLVFLNWNLPKTAPVYALAVPAILALAWLSFRLVETPVRHYRGAFLARVVPIFAGLIIVSALALVGLSQSQGRFYLGRPIDHNAWLPPLSAPYAEGGRLRATLCNLGEGTPVPSRLPQECFTPTPQAWNGRTVLLLGDSHAFAQFSLLAALARSAQYRGVALAHDGCNWALPAQPGSTCAQYLATTPQRVTEALRPGDVVLVSIYLPLDQRFDDRLVAARLAAIHAAAQAVGARLVIELPHLRLSRDARSCTREWFRADYAGCAMPLAEMERRRAWAVAQLGTVRDRLGGDVLLWDPLPALCPDGRCGGVGAHGPVLRDGNHLAARASRLLAPPFAAFLETPR